MFHITYNQAGRKQSKVVGMKVVFVIDCLITKGGMERTGEVLTRAFKADVWTTTYLPEKTYDGFKKFKVFSHPLRFYFKEGLTHIEAMLKFMGADLSDYDLVISSGSWARYVGLREENHPQIHYENTPPRTFYDLYQKAKEEMSFAQRQVFKLWVFTMKKFDQMATKKIDKIVSNSENVRKRVKKYYGIDTDVVWGPIRVQKFKHRAPEDYFLSAQAIEPEKRVDLQVKVFEKLPYKLIIVGEPRSKRGACYFEELKKITPKNVVFVGSVSDEELVKLYSRCKATIQTAMDEDLGVIPLEGMASGKPCIAVNEGGFKETIVHGKTGLLVNPPYFPNLVKAIRNFHRRDFDPGECMRRARLFSEERFVELFKNAVKELVPV